MDEFKPQLVVNNAKPEKSRKIRKLPAVSRYCPVCQSSTWAYAYRQGKRRRCFSAVRLTDVLAVFEKSVLAGRQWTEIE